EWDEKREQDWFMRDYPKHDMFYHFIQDLNHLYLSQPALYETDYDERCFRWLEIETVQECVYVYERTTVDKSNRIITALNMQNEHHKELKIGVDEPLTLIELLNTDDIKYDGPGNVNGTIETKKEEYKGHPYSFTIQLAHYASCVFQAIPKEEEMETEEIKAEETQTEVTERKDIPVKEEE
ncbi:MAG: alpha amylase C-terminal domain-containing protein, partial [Lachnospiraceae bacterium]|nr:alpha amylase C-terminal domain-containing protein [Lachnospiraceae bacterium]